MASRMAFTAMSGAFLSRYVDVLLSYLSGLPQRSILAVMASLAIISGQHVSIDFSTTCRAGATRHCITMPL